ncbi:hypothetical protein KBC75_01440 [Candidatus Shapirobacteria bacterium]|nr:hypothetical protein [Candidatus Shapirobacteria bacterium]
MLGSSTLDILKKIVLNNKDVESVDLREYVYPGMPPGTLPAIGDVIHHIGVDKLGKIDFIISHLQKNRNIGIESKVVINRNIRHIPMMDFSIKKSEKNLKKISTVWKKLMVPKFGRGVFVETDNSYHFIGTERLLDENELGEWLAYCLLSISGNAGRYKTYVDVQYVAYCILKNSMCLRVSEYPNSHFKPQVCLEI